MDLGSQVARAYFERARFKFNGRIEKVKVELKWSSPGNYELSRIKRTTIHSIPIVMN